MNIEKLVAIPNHQKVEDGYAYDPKYVGKVYQYNNKIIYFNEKSYEDYPIELFKIIENSILNEIETKYVSLEYMNEIINNELENTKKEYENSFNELKKEYDSRIDKFREEIKKSITSIIETMSSVSNDVSEISSKKSSIVFKEDLNNMIDEKLTDVYNNFKSVTETLVKKSVSEGLKDSKRDTTGKLKMTSLVMLKELGMDATEIKALAEAGLI